MRWTERQRAMLREIGVRPWFRDDVEGDGEAGGDLAVAVQNTVRGTPPFVRAEESSAALSKATMPTAPTAPSGSVPSATLAAADWFVVDGPLEAASDATRAATQAEQEALLANMLRAIGVTFDATGAEGRACHWRLGANDGGDLAAVLAQVRPRCVLALGRTPAHALLGIDEPLGRLRGKVHIAHGLPVVVTFPLAYLLRNPQEKGKAWVDLCLAAGALDAAPA